MQKALVDRSEELICYDADNGHWATVIWWILKSLNFSNVKLLQSGLQGWIQANLPLKKSVRSLTFGGVKLHQVNPNYFCEIGKGIPIDADSIDVNDIEESLRQLELDEYNKDSQIVLKGTFGSVLVAMIKQGYNNIRIQAQIESFSDSDDETNQTKSLSFYSIAGSRMPSIAILENPEQIRKQVATISQQPTSERTADTKCGCWIF